MEGGRSPLKILRREITAEIPLQRPRRRWAENIRTNLREIGANSRNWIESTQDRNYWRPFVNVALNLRVS